jgi:hypothetical protein
MLSVRKVKTKAGSIAVLVVSYKGHKVRVITQIGRALNTVKEIVIKLKVQESILSQL